jgi:hypothetical protein
LSSTGAQNAHGLVVAIDGQTEKPVATFGDRGRASLHFDSGLRIGPRRS